MDLKQIYKLSFLFVYKFQIHIQINIFISHIGIHGNNEEDKAAKSAFEVEIVKFKNSSTDLKHFITLFWQIF